MDLNFYRAILTFLNPLLRVYINQHSSNVIQFNFVQQCIQISTRINSSGTYVHPRLFHSKLIQYSTGGACVVAGGACVVAGGMHGGGRGVCGGGACMVVGGCVVVVGCAWWQRGMHGGGMHGGGGHAWWQRGCMGYDEIRSMSGWYASYWNAFLYYLVSAAGSVIQYLHILLWFTSLSSR